MIEIKKIILVTLASSFNRFISYTEPAIEMPSFI
jgi:hypothetical protein